MTTINSLETLTAYFTDLFHSSGEKALFIKPLAEYGGKGCFKLKYDNLKEQLKLNKTNLFTQGHIFSEVVEQHPEINKIHSKSLNTLRLVTFITRGEKVELISAFMRFGIGDSVVDNGSSGGLYVGVEIEKGELKNHGYRTMEFGGEKLTHHPGSNFEFKGFKIPYFREACNLVVESLERIPERWIGWDVAITPSGPIIIEANDCPDLHMSDVAAEGLLSNLVLKNLVGKINRNEKID